MARRLVVIILWILMSFLWGTLPVAPLRVFGDTSLALTHFVLDLVGVGGSAGAWIVALGGLLASAGLLWAVRTRYDDLIAGFCGLIGTIWYLATHYQEHLITPTTAAVLIGLAVLLVCLLLKWRAANSRLGEMFALAPAIAVWMNLAVLPQLQRWNMTPDTLPGWSRLTTSPMLRNDWLFPWPAWLTLLILALLTLALIWFLISGPGRTERH